MGALRSLLRPRRLLLVAFAISLLVHLLLATGVRWSFAPSEDQVETMRVEHVRMIHVAKAAPRTPAPQTPAPTAPPSSSPEPVRSSVPASTVGTSGSVAAPGLNTEAPKATIAAAPTPHPSPTSSCGGADTPVAIASMPPYPEIPAAARGAQTNGVARVKVTVDASGSVQSAVVAQTSGNSGLDLVAVSQAREATYTPATHLCKPIASDTIIAVHFTPW